MAFNAKWGPGFKYGHGWGATPFDPSRCKAEVSDRHPRISSWFQCRRPPVEGCDGFCRMHANKYISKPTGERVYEVYLGYADNPRPRLVTAKVVRRSEKQVVIADPEVSLAWDCRSHHKPEDLHFTPEAAWAAYIEARRETIRGLERSIAEQRRLLKLAEAKAEVA